MLRDKNGNELKKHNTFNKTLLAEIKTNSVSYVDIPETSYNFETSGGTVRIQVSANLVTTSGYGALIGACIDNGNMHDIVSSIYYYSTEDTRNFPQYTGAIYVNLPAGTHVLKLKYCISNSNSYALLPQYSSIYIDILDV